MWKKPPSNKARELLLAHPVLQSIWTLDTDFCCPLKSSVIRDLAGLRGSFTLPTLLLRHSTLSRIGLCFWCGLNLRGHGLQKPRGKNVMCSKNELWEVSRMLPVVSHFVSLAIVSWNNQIFSLYIPLYHWVQKNILFFSFGDYSSKQGPVYHSQTLLPSLSTPLGLCVIYLKKSFFSLWHVLDNFQNNF